MRFNLTVLLAALLLGGGGALASVTVVAQENGTGSSVVSATPGSTLNVDLFVMEDGEGTGITGVQLTLNAAGPESGKIALIGPSDSGEVSGSINAAEWDASISLTGLGLPTLSGPLSVGPLGSAYTAASVLDGGTTPASRFATVQLQVDATAPSGSYQITASGLAFPDFIGSNIADIPVTPGSALTVNVGPSCTASVVGRYVVYKGAGYAPYATTIANGKAALQHGPSSFANISAFSKGLNCIYVDIQRTGCGALTVGAGDFAFKVGNDSSVGGWADGPTPSSVTVTADGGGAGIDRVTLVWPDAGQAGAIPNRNWLQVTVLANGNTGLAANDVFYFGQCVGDAGLGNSGTLAYLSSADYNACYNNQVVPPSVRVAVTNPYDFDKNGYVNSADYNLSFNQPQGPTSGLRLISVP